VIASMHGAIEDLRIAGRPALGMEVADEQIVGGADGPRRVAVFL